MPESVLEVKNLVKDFKSFRALAGISFVLPKGQIIGFLGPNGAGKTTTINILLGLTTATAGKISYFGKDFSKHRQACLQRINFTSSFNTLQWRISVWENLLTFSYLYEVENHKEKIRNLARQLEAEDLLPEKYGNLSTGQKTRVNFIKSLLNDPEIILMDEPTASLDPDIADKTLSLIEDLNQERGLSILYTSHDMEEVARLCHEVIFLDHGRIVAQDSPINLTKLIPEARLKLTFAGKKEMMEKFLQSEKQKFSFLTRYIVEINTTERLIPNLIFNVSKAGVEITDIEVKKPTLEDVFLRIARGENYVRE